MSRPSLPQQPAPTPGGTPQNPAVRPPMGGAPSSLPGARPASAAPAPGAGDRRTLVVGRGISVQGTIQDAERLVVEGTVEASSLHATELQIPQGGVLKGQVEVEDADISGLMDGTLTVRGSLIVRATGQITGEAKCRRLQVEDGGQLTGKISMITEGSAATPMSTSIPPRPAEMGSAVSSSAA